DPEYWSLGPLRGLRSVGHGVTPARITMLRACTVHRELTGAGRPGSSPNVSTSTRQTRRGSAGTSKSSGSQYMFIITWRSASPSEPADVHASARPSGSPAHPLRRDVP